MQKSRPKSSVKEHSPTAKGKCFILTKNNNKGMLIVAEVVIF